MKHHTVTAFILLAALLFYVIGLPMFGKLVLLTGGILELWFWRRIFSRPTSTENATSSHSE